MTNTFQPSRPSVDMLIFLDFDDNVNCLSFSDVKLNQTVIILTCDRDNLL